MEMTIRDLANSVQYWKSECFTRNRAAELIRAVSPWHREAVQSDILYLVPPAMLEQFRELSPSGNYLLYGASDIRDVCHRVNDANFLLLHSAPSAEHLYEQISNILTDPAPAPSASEMLLNSLYQNQLQGTLSICARLLGNPVALLDISFNFLGASAIAPSGLDQASWIERTACLLSNEALAERLLQDRSPILFSPEDGSSRCIFAPITINGSTVAFCSVLEDMTTFAQEDMRLMEQVVQAISLELQKNDIYRSQSGLIYEYFLIKLIENTAGNREFVETRMKNLGLQITDTMYIASFRFIDASPIPQQVYFILKDLREILKARLLAVYRDHIVALVIRDTPPMLLTTQRATLLHFLKTNHLVGGVSFRFSDLSKAHTYYRQSLDAIGLGRMMHPDQPLYRLRELAVYEIFSICNLSMELQDYVLPEIYQLRAYDLKYQTDLCNTLNCFLQCGMNSAQAAKILHVHRNTLLYRLGKIKEITHLTWSGNTLLGVLLSFRLMEYLAQAKNSTNSDELPYSP